MTLQPSNCDSSLFETSTTTSDFAITEDHSSTNPRLQGKRALICEDEGVIQAQLSRALRQAGMDIIGNASDGHAAVEIALRERPDVILMDLNIPVVDGMEAARRILVEYHPCVVMVTAHSDRDFRRRASEIGASGYVVKPVTADSLLPQLVDALDTCASSW